MWKEVVHEKLRPSTDLLIGDPEVKPSKAFITKISDRIDILERLSRFSSWTTLLKVVARIKRLASKPKCLTDVVTAKERGVLLKW